jgi:hypothetical protein
MQSSNKCALSRLSEIMKSICHLLGCLVRKGQGKDTKMTGCLGKKSTDSFGKHTGLARPWASDHQQRSIVELDSLSLPR